MDLRVYKDVRTFVAEFRNKLNMNTNDRYIPVKKYSFFFISKNAKYDYFQAVWSWSIDPANLLRHTHLIGGIKLLFYVFSIHLLIAFERTIERNIKYNCHHTDGNAYASLVHMYSQSVEHIEEKVSKNRTHFCSLQ